MKWIGFDLDGTLATYTGWTGPYDIGEPIPEMVKKVQEYMGAGIPCKIFTARVGKGQYDEQTRAEIIKAIQLWTKVFIGWTLPVVAEKNFECIAIYDDRAIAVEANTGKILGGVEPKV